MISFSKIYTNFGNVPEDESPLKGMTLRDMRLGDASTALALLPVDDEDEDEPDLALANKDLAMIASVHPHYLLKGKDSTKYQEELKETDLKDVRINVKSVKNNLVFMVGQRALTREIVLAKALYLQSETDDFAIAEKRNRHKLLLCFGGHWVEKDQLQGDHVFPSGKIWERLQRVALGVLSPLFKTKGGKLNRVSWEAHHFDARNLIGLCGDCNNQKGDGGVVKWLKSNRYYGQDFVDSILPLTTHIVPRTKDGVGLGDAMISYFFQKRDALTLMADAPLMDNFDLVMKNLQTVSKIPEKELKRLLESEGNAEQAEELRKVCELVSKMLGGKK